MKTAGIIILLLFQINGIAQSPYLSVFVQMDSAGYSIHRYKIEMKFCDPLKKTGNGDWFSNDTSAIDFLQLNTAAIKCQPYFDNGLPERITGEQPRQGYNQFTFGNQVFSWEKILVFRISDQSSRGWHPDMYVVMPVKYKSFVSSIQLTNIVFRSGEVLFIDEYADTRSGRQLKIKLSLKDHATVKADDFVLREIL